MSGCGQGGLPGRGSVGAFWADRMVQVKLGGVLVTAHWGNSSWTLLQLSASAGEPGERLEVWSGLNHREPCTPD